MVLNVTATDLELLIDAVDTQITEIEFTDINDFRVKEYRSLYRRLIFELNKLD